MAKTKTFFEQVPLEVVKKIAGVEVCVNHGTVKGGGASKRKKPNAGDSAKNIADRKAGKS